MIIKQLQKCKSTNAGDEQNETKKAARRTDPDFLEHGEAGVGGGALLALLDDGRRRAALLQALRLLLCVHRLRPLGHVLDTIRTYITAASKLLLLKFQNMSG